MDPKINHFQTKVAWKLSYRKGQNSQRRILLDWPMKAKEKKIEFLSQEGRGLYDMNGSKLEVKWGIDVMTQGIASISAFVSLNLVLIQ